jgi:hypothetical protein
MQVEELMVQQIDQIPVVDTLRATRMLDLPERTIFEQRRLLGAIDGSPIGLDLVFPVAANRRFATENNRNVNSLSPMNGVLWIKRPT